MAADSFDNASAIADIARRYLLHPPGDGDAVIEYADPRLLTAAFEEVIPLPLEEMVRPRTSDELAMVAELIVKYSVHTTHPRFFNQNFAGPDPVAVAGDWLGAALNTTGATFEAAPVFTLMEAAVLSKLARVAGYPDDDHGLPPGLFAPGGSTATLYALQLARHRIQPQMVRAGAGAERFVIFVSDTGHYAAEKSAAMLGIGSDAVIKVMTDESGEMVVDALRTQIAASRARSQTPLAVIATAGTTVLAAFDPIDEIADVCAAEDIWLHVDGCYGGSALFSPVEKHRLAGVERSDSFVWNLHKMMGVTQQCTVLLVRDPTQLEPCFATGADYLFQPDKLHGEYDSGDRHFQCARRVDALKLWLTWQANGDEGFADRVDHAVAIADHLRSQISASDGEFAIVAPGDFTNVVFAWVPPPLRPFDPDRLTDAERDVMHALPPKMKMHMQHDGTAMIGFQPVGGLNCFRWLFINDAVTTTDVDDVLSLLSSYGQKSWNSGPIDALTELL